MTTEPGSAILWWRAQKVTAAVLEQGRGKKIIVYKYKKRKNERKKQGHGGLYQTPDREDRGLSNRNPDYEHLFLKM
jgi:hypothetical protein